MWDKSQKCGGRQIQKQIKIYWQKQHKEQKPRTAKEEQDLINTAAYFPSVLYRETVGEQSSMSEFTVFIKQ